MNTFSETGIQPSEDGAIEHPYVYFMISQEGEKIRIGFSKDPSTRRTEEHKKYGYTILAVVPATSEHEKYIHSYFEDYLVGFDKSTYHADTVMPYIMRLLEFHFASAREDDIYVMSMQPWALWAPLALDKPLYDREQACLFVTQGVKSATTDIWQTPSREVNLCREALGGTIDLDPASCFEANERVRARHFYDERTNGLIRDWHGSVFLNPPYGGQQKPPIVKKFIDKLNHELESGRVIRAVTVLNLQSIPTDWFPEVRRHAVIHAIYNKRINFIGPKAKSGSGANRFSSAKNGTIFSFFGDGKERFIRTFKDHAMIVEELK